MKTRVISDAGKGGEAVIIVVFVEDCYSDLVEVKLELLRKDVLHHRLCGGVIIAADGGKIGVGSRTFGNQFCISRVVC